LNRAFSRRVIAVVLATVLLHLLLLDWADGSVASLHQEKPKPALIMAQLHPIQPKTVAAPLPQPVKAAPRPRPIARVAKIAPPVGSAPIGTVTPVVEMAAAGPAGSDTAPAASGAAAPEPQAPGPAAGSAPRYQVSLPPSATLSYRLTRQEPKLDTPFLGKSLISWLAADGKYSMRTEAGLSVPFSTVNIFTLTSEGEINGSGIAPRITTEARRGRAETATHFNRDKGTITFSASTASAALTEGAQDQATVTMQLAGIGRAEGGFKQHREFDILVGESKEATLFHFVVAGQEDLETELGKFSTWHVIRPARPGSYSSRLELWFAPALDWYPVQIRNSEANGAITTQSVFEILTAGTPAPAR
jgi:hypothetical protein